MFVPQNNRILKLKTEEAFVINGFSNRKKRTAKDRFEKMQPQQVVD
jgi:hypothetical protein